MFSIDQNCLPLWDAVCKLHALRAAGVTTRHFVEDVDVPFARPGAAVDDTSLALAPERVRRSGGADWGAAVFYTKFLGRLPTDPQEWAPPTGFKPAALARQLDLSVDELYDRYAPSDNWQLVGSSYAGDRRHHRVIADLSAAEVAEHLRALFDLAREDMHTAFPAAQSRQRVDAWLDAQEARRDRLLAEVGDGSLAELYRRWLGETAEGVEIDTASGLLATGADATGTALLEVFCRAYDDAAGLYNEALAETEVGLRPLATDEGELPFFAVLRRDGRIVRTAAHLRGDELHVGDRAFPMGPQRRLPLERLQAEGVTALPGKAVLLVLQVRLSEPLAMPYRGSLYTPAVHRLAHKLQAAGLLGGELHPLIRVRFRLLDHLRELDTPIRPPEHVADALGREELPARELGEAWQGLAREAADRLEAFRDDNARRAWQRQALPEAFEELDALDARRRKLAEQDPKGPEIRRASHRVREIERDVLAATVRRVDHDTHLAALDMYDSRGALWPWCVALGGEAFYRRVVEGASIYEEADAS